jgi:hypothetical protein
MAKKTKKKKLKHIVVKTDSIQFSDEKGVNFSAVDLRKIIFQFGGAPFMILFKKEKGKDNTFYMEMYFEPGVVSPTILKGTKVNQGVN